MFDIDGSTISLTRGDTFEAEVGMTMEDEPYVPEVGDNIRFALKRKLFSSDLGEYIDPVPLIVKPIPLDSLLLVLEPEDTKELRFGTYAYDIEITFADGFVDTFIKGDFEITPEVY